MCLFQSDEARHADDAERKRGCRSRNAGNSWRSSTAASPLGLCSHLSLTPNQVRGLTKTHEEWSTALEKALTATRRDDLKHGTNAAYVAGCVCWDCREHRGQRMARNR